MSKLLLSHNALSDIIELRFKDKNLQDFLSMHIPSSTRTWNKKDGCWAIVPQILSEVIAYARHSFNHIDASSLPIKYQRVVQKALQGFTESSSTSNKNNKKYIIEEDSPYTTLYIEHGAPDFVVKAAYKALAFKYHPDRGGDTERFKAVTDAYNKIMDALKK